MNSAEYLMKTVLTLNTCCCQTSEHQLNLDASICYLNACGSECLYQAYKTQVYICYTVSKIPLEPFLYSQSKYHQSIFWIHHRCRQILYNHSNLWGPIFVILGVLLGMSFLRSSFFSFGKKDTYFKNVVDDLISWKRLSMNIMKTKPPWFFMM